MSNGSDDPSDLSSNQADPSPAPTATPGPSPNPFEDTASTEPVFISASNSSSTAAVDPTAPPQPFINMVNIALRGRLGLAKFNLIPAADKTALIDKIWQDPGIQTYWTTNNALLKDPTSAATVSGQFGNLINQVMAGQGNDPTVAVDYTNMLSAAGVPLNAAEQAALAGATQAINASVPQPFNTDVVSGYDYGAPMPAGGWSSKAPGQSFGWQTHMGVDYGTTAGTRIVSPFAGTIVGQTGVPGYGNIVYVQLDNGWVMGFGHVGAISAQNGARVNPGDLIAIAGANVGSSQGSVTIVTWQAPGGKWTANGYTGAYQNPHDVIDPIFKGTTFSAIGASGAAGTGMPSVDKVLDAEYPSVKSDWLAYFGTPPSPEDVFNVIAHGKSPAEWSDYIRALPSPSIEGMNIGQAFDLRQTVDQVSSKTLGHPGTDGIVRELYGQGIANPTAVQNWYNEHGVTGIPTNTYDEIYSANQPTMANIFNEPKGADPRDIKDIHDSMQVEKGTGHQSA